MDKYLQSYKKETKREKLERTLEEYEQLYELSECDRLYQQAIESEGNAEIRYQYGMFSLKNRLKSAE
jgi:arginine decarboxylase-like protein